MQDALGAVQSILVLGGTSEIALTTVRKLVAERCRTVVLAGRSPDAMQTVADELRGAGATTVDTVEFDAVEPDSHVKIIDEVFYNHPDIDLVLLAFGVLGDQAEFDTDPSAAARAVSANYVGAVSSGLAVANRLRRQGHGTLAVLSSVAGERARKDNFVYGSSKAGLDAFAQGLGDSLHGSGARVMVVRPGFVRTRMTEGMDDGPFATTAGAVADATIEGLRNNSHTVWVPGILRWVFGILKLLPRPLWRLVSNR